LVALAKLLEGVEEDSAGVVVVQVGKATVATEGDEVVVAEGVEAFEVARHGGVEYRWWDLWNGEGMGGMETLPRSCRKVRVMNGAPDVWGMIGPPAPPAQKCSWVFPPESVSARSGEETGVCDEALFSLGVVEFELLWGGASILPLMPQRTRHERGTHDWATRREWATRNEWATRQTAYQPR